MAEEVETTAAEKESDLPPFESLSFKEKVWRIIFEADTPPGKLFDVVLIWFIALSVLAVALETVDSFSGRFQTALRCAEWIFTAFFTIEYIVRIWCVRRKRRYIFSFFGIVDLLSIAPFYIGLVVAGSHQIAIIRILRMLRVFRVLKMARHVEESSTFMVALKRSRAKITVFLFAVLSITVIVGTLTYMVEPAGSDFTSIPKSVYWAIVTLTTVGYGDISPVTPVGQFLAATMMIMGYAVLAVPSGILGAEYVNAERDRNDRIKAMVIGGGAVQLKGIDGAPEHGSSPEEVHASLLPFSGPNGPIVDVFRCPECGADGHRQTASYCFSCASPLRDDPQQELPIWSHSNKSEVEDVEDKTSPTDGDSEPEK